MATERSQIARRLFSMQRILLPFSEFKIALIMGTGEQSFEFIQRKVIVNRIDNNRNWIMCFFPQTVCSQICFTLKNFSWLKPLSKISKENTNNNEITIILLQKYQPDCHREVVKGAFHRKSPYSTSPSYVDWIWNNDFRMKGSLDNRIAQTPCHGFDKEHPQNKKILIEQINLFIRTWLEIGNRCSYILAPRRSQQSRLK